MSGKPWDSNWFLGSLPIRLLTLKSLNWVYPRIQMLTPRYLLPFDSQTALHRFTDILIIGGGLAGLRAANAVESNQSVLVVTKDRLRESNSSYAQGGIAGVLDPERLL